MKLLIEGKCVCVLKGWGEGEKKRERGGVGPGIQVINIILTKYSSKIRTSVFFSPPVHRRSWVEFKSWFWK